MLGNIAKLFRVFRSLPAFAIYRLSAARTIVDADIARWQKAGETDKLGLTPAFFALTKKEEFRSVLYYRLPACRAFAWLLGRGAPALYLNTPNIGPGLYLQHGFATVVTAKSIGRNCLINQQVTIGYRGFDKAPRIGDNVSIRAGAKVLGDVTIGDNSVIGAGAVVIRSVPPDSVVVGNPAFIVRQNGVKCREAL
ncbi:serine O-acetyltransferase [Bradyrhizobium sp. GM24.11]